MSRVIVETESDHITDRRQFLTPSGLAGELAFDYFTDVYPVSADLELTAVYCLENGNCQEIEFTREFQCNPNTFGDLNGDGSLDFSDFLVMSFNFGKEVPDHRFGDIDCDGRVAFADFLTTSACFGNCGFAGSQPVPEPATPVFLTMFAFLFLRRS